MESKKNIYTVLYLFLLGVCLYYLFDSLDHLDWNVLLKNHLSDILSISLLYMIWLLFDVSSLFFIIKRQITWFKLLQIYLIGEAYNVLSPFMGYGGEPVRIYYMKKVIPVESASYSIILFKYIDIVAALTVGLVVVSIGFFNADFIPAPWDNILKFGIAYFAFLLMVFLLGLFNLPFTLTKRVLKVFKFPSTFQNISFRLKLLSYLLQTAARIFVVLEMFLLAKILGFHLGFEQLCLIVSFSSLSTVCFFFIPNGIGSSEVLLSKGTSILGLGSDLGLLIALGRRIRSLFWSVIGLILHLGTFRKRTALKEN